MAMLAGSLAANEIAMAELGRKWYLRMTRNCSGRVDESGVASGRKSRQREMYRLAPGISTRELKLRAEQVSAARSRSLIDAEGSSIIGS